MSHSTLAWPRRIAPALLVGVFVALCVTSLMRKSGSYDEYLVGIGAHLDLPESRFHPPLSSLIHSLPFFLWWEIPDTVLAEPDGKLRGQQIVSLRSDDWILDSARISLLSTGIALAWVVFVWGRRLYGAWGGIVAMAFYCLDPNVIAHARLITPDLTLACFAILALYRLWRLADEPSLRNRGLAGLCFGAMLLSKYTALLLVPIWLASDFAYRWASGRATRDWRSLCVDWISVLGIGGVVLWAGYGFDAGWLELGPDLEVPALARPYILGALFQWQQSQLPHDFFLMGEHSSGGWWYFYLVVLLVKMPLATLLLLVGMAFLGRRFGVRGRPEEIYLWLPPLLLLAYLSAFNTIHNGLRYLLPVLPLVSIWLGRFALATGAVGLRIAVATAIAWLAVASLWIWPDYLAYANELGGGPRNAYEWVSDSNLDWGQDLKQLGEYLRENEIDRVQLAYFGTADPAHYGIDYSYLPSPNSTLRPTPALPSGEEPPRIVALSAYHYQGVAFPNKDAFAFFHAYWPNAQVGHSILIFDLDDLRPR
jgi:hypothetical protein